jgi:protease-4
MENEPTPPSAAPPPPLAPPLLAPPLAQPLPQRQATGRGWRFFALALLVLLLGSLFINVLHLFSGGGAVHGKSVRSDGLWYEEHVIEKASTGRSSDHKIAVIDVVGMISGHNFDGDVNMVKLIKDQLSLAAEDEDVKAVLLKVDSPGGEVLASDDIYRYLEDFQKKSGKPVVASMGSLAASGGYYVSAPCQWIVANELTITGSIGVIMQGYNYRRLMDKVGLQPMVFKSGKFKDMLSGEKPIEEVQPEEKKMVQDLVDETFGKFKQIVAEGRKQAEAKNKGGGRPLNDNWRDYADGRILSGKQAHELGFVDELGGFEVAVARALKLAGIPHADLIAYQRPFDFANLFRLFGKTEATTLKVDLGFDLPRLQVGRLYFLSSSVLH